jgi:inorganic pyrophosphatase
MVFPYDFGFVPLTKGDDGDPVDVLVVRRQKSIAADSWTGFEASSGS